LFLIYMMMMMIYLCKINLSILRKKVETKRGVQWWGSNYLFQ
jgi:hypothetical protein